MLSLAVGFPPCGLVGVFIMSKGFKGIWIPKEILNLKDIGTTEKMILSAILGLSRNGGCTANNRYFAELLGITKTRVSIIITNLFKKSYIGYTGKTGGGIKENEKRVLNFNYTGYLTKVKPYNILDNIVDKENGESGDSPHSPSSLKPPSTPIVKTFEDNYMAFIAHFNDLKGWETGTKGKFQGDEKSKRQFKVLYKQHKSTDIVNAIKAMFRDQYHIDTGFRYSTPEFITRQDKFARFLESA